MEQCSTVRRVAIVLALLVRPLSGADCNRNGVQDATDLENGTAHDCDLNANPDECDLVLRGFQLGPPTAFPVAVDPRRAATADLDADGDVDLAVTSGDAMRVTLFLNQRDGVFGNGVPIVVPGQPHFVLAAQLDGDGHVDLVVASRILWNNGSAQFPSRRDLANGGFEIAAADLDADGDLDLASATSSNGFIYLFTNQGNRVFDAQPSFFLFNELTGAIRVADLDADGRADLVLAGGGGTVLATQKENGEFNMPPRHWSYAGGANTLDVADVGGDGDLDVVTAGTMVSILENQGAGELLVVQTEAIPSNPYALTLADINGDALPEILVPSPEFEPATGGFAILLNEGNNRYAGAERHALGLPGMAVAAADFNGDGGRDVALVHRNPDAVSVLMVAPAPDAADCDRNGLLDTCQADCNEDGVADACAKLSGQSRDDDGNGVPDECDPDCDGDGALDALEVAAGAVDCDRNAVPDTCDITPVLRFQTPPEHPAEGQNLAVRTGDLDGDGDLDLITANLDTRSLSLFVNDGEREFARARRLPANANVNRVEVADVDGDADLDVLTGSESKEHVILFPNLGSGSFLAPRTVIAGEGDASWDLADLDHDGDFDVLVSRLNKQDLVEIANAGSLTFQPPRVLVTYFGFSGVLLAADLNGDRLDDLLVTPVGGQSRLHLNKGDGTLAPFLQLDFRSNNFLTLADLDADGDLDLLTPSENSISTAPNLGGGTFGQTRSEAIAGGDSPLLAADMNADAVVDLVTHNVEGSVVILANSGRAGLVAGPPYASARGRPAAGDLDGDGHVDLAVAGGFFSSVQLLWGEGDRRLHAVRTYLSSEAMSLVAGDIDGDDDLDLVGTSPGGIVALKNQGTGSFDAPQTTAAPAGSQVALFDLDGDKDLDVALGSGSRIHLLKSSGNGTFSAVSVLEVGDDLLALEARDVDNDGVPDLAMLSRSAFRMARRNEQGQFQVLANPAPGLAGNSMTLADFDGDGDQDVAVTTRNPRLDRPVVVIASNRGDLQFDNYREFVVADNPVAAVAADFNQDGSPDLAVAGTFEVTVLRNAGAGNFVPLAVVPGDNLRALAAGDLDGDGFLDLILRPLAVVRNLGGARFAPAIDLGASLRRDPAGVADLDGDQDLDLVIHHSHQTVAVVFNTSGASSPDENHDGVPDDCELGTQPFHRGDANADGSFDVLDAVLTLQYSFEVGSTLPCLDAADANGDLRLDISDPIFTLRFLFRSGPAPPAPGPVSAACGRGPEQALGCEDYRACF